MFDLFESDGILPMSSRINIILIAILLIVVMYLIISTIHPPKYMDITADFKGVPESTEVRK